MPRDRLPSNIWVTATLRQISAQGGFAAVIAKGEPDSGSLTVRVNCLNGTSYLQTESRDLDGNLIWMDPLGPDPVPDEKADAYVVRSKESDPDIWIIEVEDRDGKNPFLFSGG